MDQRIHSQAGVMVSVNPVRGPGLRLACRGAVAEGDDLGAANTLHQMTDFETMD